MPRQKFRAKYGKNYSNKGKGKKFGGNKVKNAKKSTEFVSKETKKFKFIKRNQEAEEALRRQQQLEGNFKERHASSNPLLNPDDSDSESGEESTEEGTSLEQLMSTFHAAGGYGTTSDNVIESEESVDEKEESDNESDDMNEGIFKFEEQSQPRGRKYRSSEEENSRSDEENSGSDEENSDDEMPDDTSHSILRPEEYENKGNFDDSIEDGDYSGSEGSEPELDEEKEDSDDEGVPDMTSADKFNLHLSYDLSPQLLECLNDTHLSKKEILNWPTLGRLQVEIPTINEEAERNEPAKKKKKTLLDDDTVYATEGTVPKLIESKNVDLEEIGVKVQLRPHVVAANKCNVKDSDKQFTDLQCELFSIMNNYQDLFYPQRSHANGEEIRFMYTLHALNHIMKTRTKVLNHNLKLKTMSAADSKAATIIPDKYRDQGLFRTKVLIVVPFREAALRIVNILISILFPGGDKENAGSKSQVMHYKRFVSEYGGETLHFPKKNPKPEDYELTFAGNSDDTFRLGVTFTRKSIKLYSDFYSSDIIIVSPLGLRMIVGAPGDKERDYDFLASIEMLILDQADIFLAQNWDHLLHVLDHLHLQPQSARNTDFSRVRPWCLNGWSRFYRQTLLFASHELAEFRSLFNTRCSNYRGKVRLINPIENGSIKHVAVPIPQMFHRIDVSSIQSSFDQRFEYFINNILPQFKAASKAHCLIFIPSYFDFVRIRNYFKKETMNFTQICEYTKDGKIDRARSMFFHSGAHFMLYSERAHFFRRTRIKGIRHLIMYQPPTWPHFYSEMINLMQEANQNARDGIENSMSVTVLYTKYDMLQIASIVGSAQANEIAQSSKSTHVFMTGE
ncbi:U3 small nucleolar RNA-associated protein 25 homolog [Sitodiplosis mosellana]|uniref:U3 small nucleolar RNA-associated protein 25 homolog n=1 Tax=Sitodiplosis mosellana TaxID=263140 RepID=UPI002445380C|nr:U3 small nucleolar RNA-associated protein 25 homolog [Sitodiplosis mosellana]